MKINSEAHYTQCFMHDPCDRSRDGSHVSYPEGTNGYRWEMCQECDCCCICGRLVDMRNEGRQNGLHAAREAVESVWTIDPSWDGTNWNNALHEAIVAIDALREKP